MDEWEMEREEDVFWRLRERSDWTEMGDESPEILMLVRESVLSVWREKREAESKEDLSMMEKQLRESETPSTVKNGDVNAVGGSSFDSICRIAPLVV